MQPSKWKQLMLNGSITLYDKTDILDKSISEIAAEGFEVARFDCKECNEELFHKEVARILDFPTYYGENLNAFEDCLADLIIDNTGILLVFTSYQSFLVKHPELAIDILDVIQINSWRFLLEGKALLSFIQSTDSEILIPPIGGMVPQWNGEEWFVIDRGTSSK